jgi:hypothetical protein
MSEDTSAEYHVSPSRAAFLLFGLLCGGMSAAFAYGVATGQAWVGGAFGPLLIVIVLGSSAAVLLRAAISPPKLLSLDDEGAEFKNPPLKVFWRDVLQVEVWREGASIAVEFAVLDVATYVTPLTDDQKRAIKYDLAAQTIRLSLYNGAHLDELRAEIKARQARVLAAGVADPRAAESGDPFALNLRWLSTLTPDRLYRLYFCAGSFYLIRIAGQNNLDAIGMHFGLAGMAISALFKGGTKTPEDIAEMGLEPPEVLLAADKRNFKFTCTEVAEAKIEPCSPAHSHGPNVGRLSLMLSNGRRHSFQFEELRHMRCAIARLPPLLGRALAINVAWDESKGAFVKK